MYFIDKSVSVVLEHLVVLQFIVIQSGKKTLARFHTFTYLFCDSYSVIN